jgi:GNAT superfamily N-acetyltransferase
LPTRQDLPVRIRIARASDAEIIARIHIETWRSSYAGIVPDSYLVGMTESGQALRWRRILERSVPERRGRERTLVAVLDTGRPVGFVSYGPARSPRLDVGGRELDGEVYALYVALDFQDRGIGGRLLSTALQRWRRQGGQGALLWVLAANPSRFFYEAMGGKCLAARQECFAGRMLEEVAYVWPDLNVDALKHS